jgi:regulator of protease activity HflC (stomatin/prohibitin superfamily)
MFLILIGLIALVVGTLVGVQHARLGRYARISRGVGLALIVLGALNACVRQIGSGQVAVQTLFGKVQHEVLYSGLAFVNPLVDLVYFDIKTQQYTMTSVHDEGDVKGDDAIRVLTSDGLEVAIDLTILYRPMPSETPRILQEIGVDYVSKIIRPITRTKIRDNAVFYTAVDLFSNKRDEFQKKVFAAIEADFRTRGVVLDEVLVRNINLPASVKTVIESKISAEQEAQKMQFVLDKERQEAERKRVEAQGIADYQRILSMGLSSQLLQYEMIKAQKELALSPNAKIVIMGDKTAPIILGQ